MSWKLKPRDYEVSMILALEELAQGQPDVAVPWKQAQTKILGMMGLDINDAGIQASSGQPFISKQLQSCWRALKRAGWGANAKAGSWALTPEGIAHALELQGKTAPVPAPAAAPTPAPVPIDPALAADLEEAASELWGDTPETAAAAAQLDATLATLEEAPVEVAETVEAPAPVEQGESWNFVTPPGNVPDGATSSDPYRLSLQVAQATCYGDFNERSKVCAACPVRVGCFDQIKTKLASMMAELELEEREAAKRVALPSIPAQPDPVVEPEPEPAPAPEDCQWDASKAEPIIATLETSCVKCGSTVKKGGDCKWIPGVGVFHPDCLPG